MEFYSLEGKLDVTSVISWSQGLDACLRLSTVQGTCFLRLDILASVTVREQLGSPD